MKKIYFVRHGQSEGNTGSIRQTKDSSLTDIGVRQSEFVAKRISKLPIEKVISSTMTRAEKTAQIIEKEISKEIIYSNLFVERRRPSEQYGIPKDDPVALEAERLILENFTNTEYHYSDEENFLDLKARAEKALDFLSKIPEENILVVTHGYILKVFMAYAIFGEKLTADECNTFIKSFQMHNTGITLFSYKEDSLNNKWHIRTWNDVAHLDEL